ncbi:SDR family oxidoreductase [Rhodococcus sp. HM1]|uniref:SDR family NAD(P)-dependent oxidoreductase n=1 Tax=Rhodococcus sp. HM1 TaxID=2937759 RepID=UPI0027DFA509|nr:SDR family oxidoreductase [Rhodococcus sp. HM1]
MEWCRDRPGHSARAGHEVGFAYPRDTDAAIRLVAECGPRVRAIQIDVADTDAAETGVDTAAQSPGEVTVLVNNAGITGPLGDVLTETAAQVRDIVDVNVFGVVGDDRGCGSLPARDRVLPGVVITGSSIAAVTGGARRVRGIRRIQVLRWRRSPAAGDTNWHRDIRVVGMAPGSTDTEIHAAAGDPGRPRRVADRIPHVGVAATSEIAAAAGFAAGEDFVSHRHHNRVAGGL